MAPSSNPGPRMIKRTIEISSAPAHLTTKNKQFVVKRSDEIVGSIPCEDIGMVVVDHSGTTYSHSALTALLKNGATLVVCGRDHLPAGILLPMSTHSTVVWRIKEQLAASRPLQKQLWRQLVQAKIRNQAAVLDPELPARKKLLNMAREVRSGDSANMESQAARVYWKNFLSDEQRFYRDQDGRDGLNSFLNYGYAIIRAEIARAIVAAGLLPAIGLHHRNRGNPFCLADDLIEPFRPLVDFYAREMHEQGYSELTPEAKRILLKLLASPATVAGDSGPVMVAVQRLVSSLVRSFGGKSNRLAIPDFPKLLSNVTDTSNEN